MKHLEKKSESGRKRERERERVRLSEMRDKVIKRYLFEVFLFY